MNVDKYDFGSPDKIKVVLDHKITNQGIFFWNTKIIFLEHRKSHKKIYIKWTYV